MLALDPEEKNLSYTQMCSMYSFSRSGLSVNLQISPFLCHLSKLYCIVLIYHKGGELSLNKGARWVINKIPCSFIFCLPSR